MNACDYGRSPAQRPSRARIGATAKGWTWRGQALPRALQGRTRQARHSSTRKTSSSDNRGPPATTSGSTTIRLILLDRRSFVLQPGKEKELLVGLEPQAPEAANR